MKLLKLWNATVGKLLHVGLLKPKNVVVNEATSTCHQLKKYANNYSADLRMKEFNTSNKLFEATFTIIMKRHFCARATRAIEHEMLIVFLHL